MSSAGSTARIRSRDGDEQLVARRVAEAVVHGLEVVEVDEEDGEEVPPARSAFDRVRDPLREERAVRETRERVVERLVRELILERAALGDVSRGHHDAADVRDAEQVVEDALELDDACRPSGAGAGRAASGRRHRAHLGEEPAELLGVLVLEELGQPPSDELVLAVAEHALDRRRVVADRQVGREQGDDVARVLDERAEPLGALALVEIRREIGALERQRDLRSECLDALPRLPGETLARAERRASRLRP